ncbi:MAG: ABC transporter substrate-binding protein [Clostridia bacterium]|nr:ABC transporter substrate-binding protein [Clostridia bacterium]
MFAILLAAAMLFAFAACGKKEGDTPVAAETMLVYASGDYTRINPAIDEHGEINILLFNGLTAHDGSNDVAPALAERWDYDADTYTYTFHMVKDAKWHDGEAVTADDVKFTIEAIMDPANESENAPNFEDVEEITVIDAHTVAFRLAAPNVAFLDYMTMAVLPRHLLEGEDMQTGDFFRNPVGTGPYKLERWDEGQAITLVKNEDYFKGAANIDKIVFKIVEDDTAKALQLRSGELDLALLTPKDAESFADNAAYTVYNMKTSDYRGIMFNFANDYWTKNRDVIPAICYGIDRQAIVDSVLRGHGTVAYGPLQRNIYNNEDVEQYTYDPEKAEQALIDIGCEKGADGFYYRDGEKIAFTCNCRAGDQARIDIANAAAQQLRAVGIDMTVEIPAVIDWSKQMAFLIGWGSPFDADDHTYKVFGAGKGANYSGYSNDDVDAYLTAARRTDDPAVRAAAYAKFQSALASDPPYAFICYIDADYVATAALKGIAPDTVMGHHGVGIFWNVTEWQLA